MQKGNAYKFKAAVILGITAVLIMMILYLFLESDLEALVVDCYFVFIAVSVILIVFYNFLQTNGSLRYILLLLTLGSLGCVFAEIIWAIERNNLVATPLNTMYADFFWLGGTFLFVIAIFFIPLKMNYKMDKNKIIIRSVLIILLFLGISLILIYGIIIPTITNSRIHLMDKVIDITYPVLNILLLAGALNFILVYGMKIALAWKLLIAGFICDFIADTLYGYFSIILINENHDFWPDFFWIIGYILLALGTYNYYLSYNDKKYIKFLI
ncbi:MAG: hypothetical protein JW969_00170 [Spirochaetales bacterium]|nr:hypothetical protein [Spirochaetales bacterium]